jgi:hypothetical protein
MAFVTTPLTIVTDPGGVVSSSMTGNLVSLYLNLQQIDGFSFQAIYTGSPVGTFTLECTNDDPDSGTTTWVTVDGSSFANSGAGSYMWNLINQFYYFVRLRYVFTSGSGTLIVLLGKEG